MKIAHDVHRDAPMPLKTFRLDTQRGKGCFALTLVGDETIGGKELQFLHVTRTFTANSLKPTDYSYDTWFVF